MKEKKTTEKISAKGKISAEDILKRNNEAVLEFVDGIKNNSERNAILQELINYLGNCLLDRDAGKPGPKLIDQLKERNKKTIETVKEYKLEELIWWKGSEPMILYLFDLLFAANLIDDSNRKVKNALISKHFRNEKGQRFDNVQLGKSYSRMKEIDGTKKPPEKDADKIESVLRDIRILLKERKEEGM